MPDSMFSDLSPEEELKYEIWRQKYSPKSTQNLREIFRQDPARGDETDPANAVPPIDVGEIKKAKGEFDLNPPEDSGPRNAAEEVLFNLDARNRARSTFGNQFAENLVKTGSLGYFGPDAPVDLPLSGELGKYAGEAVGFIPAIEAAGSGVGMIAGGLLKELGTGFLYGMAEKPEDAQDDIYGRMKNGVKTALGFGAGWAALRGAGKLLGKVLGPNELERLLASGAEDIHGPPEPEPIHGPPEPPPFGEGEASGGGGPPTDFPISPSEPVGPNFPRGGGGIGGAAPEDVFPSGEPPPVNPANFAAPMATRAGRYSIPKGVTKIGSERVSPEDFSLEELKNMVERGRSGIQLSAEKESEGVFGKLGLPEITKEQADKITESNLYEGHVNSWAGEMVGKIEPGAEYLEQAGRKVVSGDVEAAAKEMTEKSVLHAMNQTPRTDEPVLDSLTPKLETRTALESNVDRLVTKYGLPIEVVQAGTKMAEPINYWMSKGMNFNDAADLADSLVKRAKMPFDPTNIPEEVAAKTRAEPAKIPEWDVARKRMYSPQEVEDLFFNVPLAGSKPIEHGLIELNPNSGGLHLTERGYGFLKEYNPEGLIGQVPEFVKDLPGVDENILGAIRGKGKSNINLSPENIQSMFGKMPEEMLQEGNIRKAAKGGKELPGQYQLEEKGAKMLSEGRAGSDVSDLLYSSDFVTGVRKPVWEAAGKAADETQEALFGDIFDSTEKMGKKC